MSDYPSNAKNPGAASPTPQRQRLTPVITNVAVRKTPWTQRFTNRTTTIFQDVVAVVIGPYIRDMFADAFHRGVDQAFNTQGTPAGYRTGSKPSSTHMTSSGYVVTDYSAPYNSGSPAPGPMFDPRAKPFDFSKFTFTDYGAGRELMDRLIHVVHSYGRATVNDLYDLFGQDILDHTGENYGWEGLQSLQGMDVKRVRGGGAYFLDIPDPRELPKR